MLQVKIWLSILLVAAVMAVPVMAGTNDSKTTNENSANPPSAEASPAAASPSPSPSPSVSLVTTASDANVAALLGALVKKGVLDPSEAAAIRNAAPGAEFQLLIDALSRKGILSAADLAVTAQPSAAVAVPVAATETLNTPEAMASSQAAGAPPVPPPPAVIPAIAPVRVFPVDAPKTGGLLGLKIGPVTIAPYGFLKATVIHDSSDPDGDDFAFPALFLNAASSTNTGPTKDPEVHIKARSTRFGMNFEWPDVSKNLTLTGKIEGDFEGNNTEVDNADISSFRNGQVRLRLAFVRMDYHASENTDIFFVG